MSWGAQKFVKEMFAGPSAKRLTTPQKHLLSQVAIRYDDGRGCCMAAMGTLAADCGWSVGHTRTVVAALEARDVLRRYLVDRVGDGSQGTNDIELVGYVLAVDAAARVRTLRVPRRRAQVQAIVRRGGRQARQGRLALVDADAGSTGSKAQLGEAAGVQVTLEDAFGGAGVGDVVGDVSAANVALGEASGAAAGLLISRGESLPPTKDSALPGAKDSALPIDSFSVFTSDSKPHSVACFGSVEKPSCPWQEPKTKATAKATATTPALRSATEARGSCGSANTSSGAWSRPHSSVRSSPSLELDGEPAAVALEVDRVMLACGFTPGRLGLILAKAIRLRVRARSCSIAEAGDAVLAAWMLYVDEAPLLRWQALPGKFFETGMWQTPNMWPRDGRKVAEFAQSQRATVGMFKASDALARHDASKALWQREREDRLREP